VEALMNRDFIFPAKAQAIARIHGNESVFPVHRIYCVGRNFADHAKEMGAEAPRGQPIFFMKPADAIVTKGGDIPYPSATANLHHEVELIVAIDRDAEGEIALDAALDYVFGYGVGLDLTRRDLQSQAKEQRLPWDTSKGFDHSAPISALLPKATIGALGDIILSLYINDELRQRSALSDMIFSVQDIIHELSKLYRLQAGDILMMGTPSGVGPMVRGDRFIASLEGHINFHGNIAI
jgi:fumarylpyruvate hydrolase